MSNCPLSRKAREKLARQQEIVAAARELFLRQGYHETTLEEIAHHAEFGKGTIYNYFASNPCSTVIGTFQGLRHR